MTGHQQMQAPSPAVAIGSFVAGTTIQIAKESLHGIEELKTIGTVGFLLVRQQYASGSPLRDPPLNGNVRHADSRFHQRRSTWNFQQF